MSGVFRAMGTVSGIAATVLSFIPGGQVFAAAFAANAAIMNTLAAVTAKKPPMQGAVTNITIGSNMPSPCIIGESYYGGSRVAQVGYGEEDDVPNAHLWVVDVYSVAGPLSALMATYTDFQAVTFGSSPDNNADGYFYNNLHRHYQLGATPESAALMPHWSGAPDWGTGYKLSGKAAIGWSARWPKKENVFASGFPQTGAVWRGVLCYDPRKDNTRGGSGAHRWADPIADSAGHAAAKATWEYSANPGLHALHYALGRYERDESDSEAVYRKVFGVGGKIDQLVLADFIALANLCDANGWSVNGVIFEPGNKWENMKRLCAAGGAAPTFKGGRLGLAIHGPKVALDTITLNDIADGVRTVAGTRSWRERKNTLVPRYVDPNGHWQTVALPPVQVTEYVTQDGEERSEEYPLDLVTDPDQAAQLTGVELVSRREVSGITLPLTPRLRRFRIDDCLEISAEVKALHGIASDVLVIEASPRDLQSMTWNTSFRTETPGKFDYAYALTASSPPVAALPTPAERDGVIHGSPALVSATIRGSSYVKVGGDLLTAEDAGDGTATIFIAEHSWDYPVGTEDVVRAAGSITGLDLAKTYYVYFDDASLANGEPSYFATDVAATGSNSSSHPFRHSLGAVATPGAGGAPTTGTGGGGGISGPGRVIPVIE